MRVRDTPGTGQLGAEPEPGRVSSRLQLGAEPEPGRVSSRQARMHTRHGRVLTVGADQAHVYTPGRTQAAACI